MFSLLTSRGQRLSLVLQKIPKYYFSKALKQDKPEEYLKVQPLHKPEIIKDGPIPINIEKFDKKSYVRGLTEDEKPIPTSPILGPMRIENPKVSEKTYRWCSCGMSLKQPFCDNSHKGTQFKPLRFTVEEETKAMDICGCKFSKQAPYCDGETCVKLRNGEINKGENEQ